MECQTPGVQWPSVTRPADNTDALPLLSAPRLCVCGHPVYDDQEPRCPLCACQEHKRRLLTADDHSAPATAAPGTGEAWRGPQPKLSGAVPVLPSATARRGPGAVSANAIRQRHPAARGQRARPWAVPGAHSPCGRDRSRCRQSPSLPGIRPGCGRPRPHLPGTSIPAHAAAVPAELPDLARKRAPTEVSSGLAASSADGKSAPPPKAPCRCPAHSWQATGPVWGVSATHISTIRVPVTSRSH
jgi:hypothetical protein